MRPLPPSCKKEKQISHNLTKKVGIFSGIIRKNPDVGRISDPPFSIILARRCPALLPNKTPPRRRPGAISGLFRWERTVMWLNSSAKQPSVCAALSRAGCRVKPGKTVLSLNIFSDVGRVFIPAEVGCVVAGGYKYPPYDY